MNLSTAHDMNLNVSPLARLRAYASHSVGARILTTLALLLTLALFITPTAMAKRQRPTPDPVPAGMQRILEVNALTIKVAVGTAGDSSQSYSITDATKVTMNGAPSNARDLKAGMLAKIEPSADGRTAVSITAQDPVAHPGRNRVG
jgi:hypothetical protein